MSYFHSASRRSWSLLFGSLAALALVLASIKSLGAEQPDHKNLIEQKPAPAGLANHTTDDQAAEVARQVLELQQQLGGSIIDQSQTLAKKNQHTNKKSPQATREKSKSSKKPKSAARTNNPNARHKKVSALRNASWQLETSAHKLENLNLYHHADNLRKLAQRLRQDARNLQAVTK